MYMKCGDPEYHVLRPAQVKVCEVPSESKKKDVCHPHCPGSVNRRVLV
jgi:hypothetical protein